MPPAPWWTPTDPQGQRDKLANSYQELLSEFNSKDLRTVGNYTVGRLIGKGSFGKVYLASHKLTNGSKVVLKSAKKDDQNLAREIHHHRQFIHPHIARLYEVIVTEKLVWLVLEWCPGDELYNHLLNNGRMEESQVQKIFTQLVGAVTYVHNKGCVHRDLKLENILLDKHGNVKLVDFGFTREYQGTTSYLQTWCGTVAYSAPEMIKGEKYAGEKVDVWSLGIILYALLAGELPFDDDDDNVTKDKILKNEPAWPDHYPAAAKELTQKLLSKRPLLRPTLPDILRSPWLSDHAPLQQEILKLQQPPPFATPLERETLARMRSAGVDIDQVIEHVLGQRCDGLAGWWALLIEKEERKAKRRERKRKEKEAEEKAIRRLSAASGRLLTPSLRDINEEEHSKDLLRSPNMSRGRHVSRTSSGRASAELRWARLDSKPDGDTLAPELPRVAEQRTPTPELRRSMGNRTPTRSTSSTRRRPIPPPKEYTVMAPKGGNPPLTSLKEHAKDHSSQTKPPLKRSKLYQSSFRNQLATIKAWFKDPAKKTKAEAEPRRNLDGASNGGSRNGTPVRVRRSSAAHAMEIRKSETTSRPEMQTRSTVPARPRLSTASSHGSAYSGPSLAPVRRLSVSPAPLTPNSNSMRRRSGLGGRKSTSSSVSSVRSIHIRHPSGISHSKASSTSSASVSIASPNMSNPSASRNGTQSGSGLKGLAASPSPVTLPPAIRVQRRQAPGVLGLGSLPSFGNMPSGNGGGAVGPSSPGMHAVFARQKRKVFKGPMTGNSPRNRNVTPTPMGGGGSNDSSREQSRARRSVEIVASGATVIVEEEEEDSVLGAATTHGDTNDGEEMNESDEDIEEVDHFSPAEEAVDANPEDGYFQSVHNADIDGPASKSEGGVIKGVGYEDCDGNGRLHLSVERLGGGGGRGP